MPRSRPRRFLALLVSAALLASLTVATVASPASAAKPKPKCQGFKATIVGTKKADRLVGTAKRDIIVARGGNDRIYGKGGNDVVCAGPGNDRVFGGPGADRLWGQLGHDRVFGNAGPDFLAGQVGNDTLVGGIGVDTCFQGTGSGPVLSCERPAPPPAAPPPGPSLLPLTGILAVAYSDIDGLDGYSSGDVMIALLRDTNGDGVPSPDDRVEMDAYPLDIAASTFGEWSTKSHDVAGIVAPVTAERVTVTSTTGHQHDWYRLVLVEGYEEGGGGSRPSWVRDGLSEVSVAVPVENDQVHIESGSPSNPQTATIVSTTRFGDDPFIDVTLNYPEP